MKILAAEDDLTSREILRAMLQRWGYDVVTAANGDQAWEILHNSQEPPRLAILDWMMPGRNGIDICREVREHTPSLSVYIMLLTSLASKSDIVAGLDAGAHDYVIKPFDRAELLARIQVGCRVIELQNALESRVQQLELPNSEDRPAWGGGHFPAGIKYCFRKAFIGRKSISWAPSWATSITLSRAPRSR